MHRHLSSALLVPANIIFTLFFISKIVHLNCHRFIVFQAMAPLEDETGTASVGRQNHRSAAEASAELLQFQNTMLIATKAFSGKLKYEGLGKV